MKTRGIVLSALFAALLAVFSFVQIPIPWSPVPVVLENIVPMLAGALLGPVRFFQYFSGHFVDGHWRAHA